MRAFPRSSNSPAEQKPGAPSPQAPATCPSEDSIDPDVAYERIVELRRSFDKGLISRERFDELKDQVLWPNGQPDL
ncbi:hypothetical protein [Adlercreutzia aquisgranensis]|uniref:hypothetical protein n=1 Tax=Adlercreutzia aquisgranensis TaxID=2941323 RepID=UPI00203FF6DA|nr:hypothetical protein [Adlercreutzia aquisgranensis]